MTDQEPPPRSYPVGAIVNGHVWTGTEWVPALNMPDPPAETKNARAVNEATPTLSDRFQSLHVAARIAILAGVGVVVIGGYLLVEPYLF